MEWSNYGSVNTSRPSDVDMRQRTRPSLVHMMGLFQWKEIKYKTIFVLWQENGLELQAAKWRSFCCDLDALQWRHNECDGVSNPQPHDCLLKRLFGRRSRKTSKIRVTGICVGNSLVTGEFPAQRASNAENVSIWRCHHGIPLSKNYAQSP